MTKRNVFISFHQENEYEVTVFCERYADYFNEMKKVGISTEGDDYAKKIESGDAEYVMRKIREDYIAGTTCTIVLLGKCTWARRYVDWEIAATLRNNKDDPRGGLIGVQLGAAHEAGALQLPPRLDLNVDSKNGVQVGYARAYSTPKSDGTIATWVEDAVARSNDLDPAIGSTTDLRTNSSACE